MSEEAKKPSCLFVGRFQPFHNGHLLVVEGMAKVCSKVVIAIGSPDKQWEAENPFSAEERRDMIQRALQAQDIIPRFDVNFVNVPDEDDDEAWTKNCLELAGDIDMIWTGNPHTKECFANSGKEIKDIKEVPGISSTEIREMMKTGGDWHLKVPPEVVASIESIDGVKRVKGV